MTLDNPRTYPIALDNDPSIAQEIGLLLSAFAIMELSPPNILAKLTGMSKSDAEHILGHFRNFSSRLDVIEGVALSRPETDNDAQAASALIKRIRESTIIRNKYAHSLWQQIGLSDGKSTFKMISWISDSNKTTTAAYVTPETIKEDCATVRATLFEAVSYGPILVPEVQPPVCQPTKPERQRPMKARNLRKQQKPRW